MSTREDEWLETEFQKIEKGMYDKDKTGSFAKGNKKEMLPKKAPTPRKRIASIKKPDASLNYVEWLSIIQANFPDLLFAAELGVSIMAQILITDISNPFALVLVGVPSSGKTIVLNFFADIDELTYASDKFTPASFVSNAANVNKEKLPEIDLLPRLQYRLFLIRDLATLFSKREEDLNECLGILTRVLDGEGLNTDTGVHGQRGYAGDFIFMLLAASTPPPQRIWRTMGSLGSRLFFYNLNSKDKSEFELASQLGATTHKDKEMSCRKATALLLQTLWSQYPEGITWDSDRDDQELKLIIARCAKLLACLRGVVNVESYKDGKDQKYKFTTPLIEKPDRISQLLYNLCRGHALVSGRQQINKEDVLLAIEIAIDSAPINRTKVLRKLLGTSEGVSSADVEKILNCSKPTALLVMETLEILGVGVSKEGSNGEVGRPEKILTLGEEFRWFITDECAEIRGIDRTINKEKSPLYEDGEQ